MDMADLHRIDEMMRAEEEKQGPRIPLSVDLWDVQWISAYLKRSPEVVRGIVKMSGFPKPVCLPGAGKSHRLYLAREVVAWTEAYRAAE
jgi:hypothetical protein